MAAKYKEVERPQLVDPIIDDKIATNENQPDGKIMPMEIERSTKLITISSQPKPECEQREDSVISTKTSSSKVECTSMLPDKQTWVVKRQNG